MELCELSVYQRHATRSVVVANVQADVDADRLRAACENYGPVLVSVVIAIGHFTEAIYFEELSFCDVIFDHDPNVSVESNSIVLL